MTQGRGKRLRKVQKVPPPQQPATTTVTENVAATTVVPENVSATTVVRENVPIRTNMAPRANMPPQANMPPPIQLPTQQGMPFVCTGVKRKRGKSCGKALQELIKINGGPLRVDFHLEMNVPSDSNISKMLTSEIGIGVRSGAPVCHYGWSDIDEEPNKRELREDLRVFFAVDLTNPIVVKYLDSKFSTAYSQFKNRLKKEWKTFGSPELGRASMPCADLWNERPVAHWHWLCDNIYTNQSCIDIAEKNSVNRYMQQHTHRAGARPYVQHALVAFKDGKELSLIHTWGEKHKDNNHEWINEIAKNKYEKMDAERNILYDKLIQATPENSSRDSIKLAVESEFPIMAKELGRKGRMIHGVGNVPHIHPHTHRVSAYAGNSTEVAEMRALIDQLSSNMLIMKQQNGHLMAQVESLLRQPSGQCPVAFTQLFQFLIQSITTIFIGHLGDLQLSAVSLSHNVINAIAFGFLQGMANALGTLCGQAYGAGQVESLGIFMQRSCIILAITCSLLSSLYIFATPFLKILGQEDSIADFAGKYSVLIIPQMFSFAINLPTQKFLQAQSKVGVITWISFVALITHTGLLYLFISVLGWGVNGAAVAYNITFWEVAVGQFLYATFLCKEGWNGFSWLAFKDIWAFARLSLASCMMFCLEMWYNMSLNLLAGHLENAVIALGSFSICLNFQSWEIMFLAGINAAISIRVSNELGMGHPRAAKYSICVAVLQSLIVGIVSMTFIFISRDYIAIVFTDSEVMQRAVARLAYFLGVTMLLSSVAQVLTGVAVGGGWQVMVAYINLAAYYLFGLPLAIFLGFKENLGPMGLYGGIISGSALQIVFLLVMTSRTNWDSEVEQTTKRIKKWGSKEIRTEKIGC